ncbi:MAG: ABC transporter permease, partial [Anaerolineales bacterium]|nr:ABC transporter permease [Anaerolineales bacterium]
MSSRWKKVWADFWGNKSRTTLTILTVMVGAFAVGFNSNMALYMSESMDGDYLSAQPSEANIYTSPFDDDVVNIARTMPGVDAVEGRRSTGGRLIPMKGEPISIQFTGVDNPRNLTLNLLKPQHGVAAIPIYGEKELIMD